MLLQFVQRHRCVTECVFLERSAGDIGMTGLKYKPIYSDF